MKTWFLLIAMVSAHLAWAEEITLANGQVVKGDISRVEPDGLVVMTDSGVEKISFHSLPEETRKRFGFDFEKAEAYRKQMASGQQQLLQQMATSIREQQTKVAEMQKNQPTLEEQQLAVKIEASAFMARAKVVQGTRDGVRVRITTQVGQAAATMLNKDTRQIVNVGEGFIRGMIGAEGELWTGKLYPAGYHIYTTPFGEERTIRAYVLSVAEAVKHGATGQPVVSGSSIPGTGGPQLPGTLRGGTMLDR
jgi:hypothetical protein